MCGTALDPTVAQRWERRVVSIVFADLVGFTSRSERLDVEDVQAFLGRYHELLRHELESHGGLVEKFIGDAVMGLFGAPVAHEDDPERAVRAALAIQDAAGRMRDRDHVDLHVRVGVTSGEALIALGVDPLSGEGMATGDVVNTAARLQSAAPVDGVLVDEQTYRSSGRAIHYEPAAAIRAKGKEAPVAVWVATAPRSLVPEQKRAHDTPLVGRSKQLAQLVAAFERAREEPSTQLVSVVGEPGIGKTRLLDELASHVNELPELVTWRRGRSLSYGEGVAFWALGEMVKAQAGILESDSLEVTTAKLADAVGLVIAEGRDSEWVTRHLRPLVGLESVESVSVEGGRVEAFAAWRRFFETVADDGPTVLTFEDLHWADDALLDFIDLLTDRAGAVPLLIACTARPELLERRPGWSGGKTNATTISLLPLSFEDTASVVSNLLDQPLLPEGIQQALLGRADGNPLYAQEFVRMLQDRGDLVRGDAGWQLRGEAGGLPESIQGIIAARLDTLAPDERLSIQDAAVIGETAWVSAACALTKRTSWEAEELLYSLERKQLVQRTRRPSISGEVEFRFGHALTRDVAYSQIPRAKRATKHEAAAAWIEQLAGERDDKAELLADHYHHALTLRAALGEDTTGIEAEARAAFTEAADQAAAVHAHAAAARHYHAALQLTSSDDPQRAKLLLGEARSQIGANQADEQLLTTAVAAQVEAEDWEGAAKCEMLLAVWHYWAGDGDEQEAHQARAAEYASRIPPTEVMCDIAAQQAIRMAYSGNARGALELTATMVPLAEQADLAAGHAILLLGRGYARLELGDSDAIADVRTAADGLAQLADSRTPSTYVNLGSTLNGLGDLPAAEAAYHAASQWAARFANAFLIDFVCAEQAFHAYHSGEWETAERLLAGVDTANAIIDSIVRTIRGPIKLARGDAPAALSDAAAVLSYATDANDVEFRFMGLALEARAHEASGDTKQSWAACDQFLTTWGESGVSSRAVELCDIAPILATFERHADIHDAALRLPLACRWRDALLLIADSRYGPAADVYEQIGSQPIAAEAHLLAAKKAAKSPQRGDAQHHIEVVLSFADKTGATLYRQRVEQDQTPQTPPVA